MYIGHIMMTGVSIQKLGTTLFLSLNMWESESQNKQNKIQRPSNSVISRAKLLSVFQGEGIEVSLSRERGKKYFLELNYVWGPFSLICVGQG